MVGLLLAKDEVATPLIPAFIVDDDDDIDVDVDVAGATVPLLVVEVAVSG